MLPIESVLPEALSALNNQNLVLIAPPGAGKSTRLPLALLGEWLEDGKRILMLQPRRVVVRALATYLARQLGEQVGQTIGYQIRGERKRSNNTKLEIVTEGVLTRRIQSDPELEDVDLLIFDEFHERSLHADLGLALSIEVQASLRPDLRLLVMSATLEGANVSSLLPGAMHLEVEGRSFPLEFRYAPLKPHQDQTEHVISTIRQALREQKGSILVFLAGSNEIRRVAERLEQALTDNTYLFALYGELDKRAQMQAIAPAKAGQRKIVLATNIAETSLTIEGINTVVDTGFEKVAYFDPRKGLTKLKTQATSMASATQRAGRAGRLEPGVCYRLWSEELNNRKSKQLIPAMLREDITAMMLDVAVWGSEISSLSLLDTPAETQQQAAQDLLMSLGALDDAGKATSHGRKMAEFGNHPRLASLLIRAQKLSPAHVHWACLLTALLEERRQPATDIAHSLQSVLANRHHPVYQQATRLAKRLNASLDATTASDMSSCLAELLALAFSDRIARHRGEGRYLLANGSGGWIPEQDMLAHADWLVVADMQMGNHADARITSALEISYQDIVQHCQTGISEMIQCDWQTLDGDRQLRCKQQQKLGTIVLRANSVSGDSVQQQAADAWQQEIEKLGWDALPVSKPAQSLITRLLMARQLVPEFNWPDVTPQGLIETVGEWLIPMLANKRKWSELRNLDWQSLIKNQLDWAAQQKLEQCLPAKFTAPTGTSVNIDYRGDGSAYVAIKLTEMYGVSEQPAIANGRLPLTLSLLSPAMRPVQTTQNIVSFWQGSYRDVQKDMKARYPKLIVNF